MSNYTDIQLLAYQENLSNQAKNMLDIKRKVGMDIFTRGGKSYIAMDLISYLVEEYGCRDVAVIAPKAIVENLKNNIFRHFKYKDKIVYINNETLSRFKSLKESIRSNGKDTDTIDILLFDEAHTTFGNNIRQQLDSESDYVYSKFVIAMTATSVNNLKGIDALPMIVGSECVVHYAIDKAIHDGIVNPIKYIPGVLKYSNECVNKIEELKKQDNINTYVMELIEKLEKEMDKLNCSIEQLVFNYIKDKIKLPSDKGGRVFVFFNTMDEVKYYEDAVTNIIKKLYTYWGNTGVRVNYVPYISSNTAEEDDYALSIIGGEPVRNQIDVIATVNKGAFGIHPSSVHFGMIMCGTKSIARYMQMVGRLTNLKAYDEFDTVVFDLRDNVSFLGKVSMSVGRQKIRDRRKYKREKAWSMFNTDIFNNDNISSVELEPCEELELSLEMFERIQYLNVLTTNNSSLIAFLASNISVIDAEYHGNIERWFESLCNDAKKDNDCTILNRYMNMADKYHNIRTALLYDSFSSRDKEIISKNFGFIDYRVYINKGDSDSKIDYIKELYNDFITELNKKKVSKKFIDKYALDYLVGNMTSPCYAMIQSEDKIADALLSGISSLSAEHFNVDDIEIVELANKLLKKVNKLSNNKDMLPDNRKYTWIEIRVLLDYLEKLPVEGNTAIYLDNIVKYIKNVYSDVIDLYFWGQREEQSYADRINKIVIAYKTNNIENVGLTCDNTICYIANNFNNINDIYSCALKLIDINTCKQFYENIVYKSKMYNIVNTALSNNDKAMLTELSAYIDIERLPKKLSSAVKKSGIMTDINNYTLRDIKITVQSIMEDTNKKAKIIRSLIKKNMVDEAQIISLAFKSNDADKVISELYKMEDNEYTSRQITLSVYDNNITFKLLESLYNSNIFSTKYMDILTRIINDYKDYSKLKPRTMDPLLLLCNIR